MKRGATLLLAALLLSLPAGDGLRCYTCLFPTVSPLECLKFELTCPPSERCSATVATGYRGDFQFVLHDRSCSVANLCDKSGMRSVLGINFTYHTTCCDTDLCNAGTRSGGGLGGLLLTVTLPLLTLMGPHW
ncbi:lymphocyte antigen 6 complex locus protein G6c [Ambystoma mexicanum]|uniref:lymphocyte antigen 6 complex locus protein G6c n=1 Tax=Ambystoma mexicanum TaxID=8296 RepID=UPI0037E7A281